MTRFCGTCGEPIGDHGSAMVPAQLVNLIYDNAPHLSVGRSRVRAASRLCPLVKVSTDPYPTWARARAAA